MIGDGAPGEHPPPQHVFRAVPEGSVVITPADMYAEIRATHDEVKRLGNVLDPALESLRRTTADHEARLRAVEQKVWVASGTAAAVAAFAGSLLTRLFT